MGPKGVAVDKNGHIITVDNKACCVFIFQSNGKLVTKFGARGTSDRHFAGNTYSTRTYDHVNNNVSYVKTRCTPNNASCLRACGWARFTDFFWIYLVISMFSVHPLFLSPTNVSMYSCLFN